VKLALPGTSARTSGSSELAEVLARSVESEGSDYERLSMVYSLLGKLRKDICLPLVSLAAFGILAMRLVAEEPIVPQGWNPSLRDEIDYLKSELESEQAQQGINRLAGHISSLLDAELFMTYLRLADRLDSKARPALKKEQADWLKQREKVTRIAGKRSEGGSASPMEENNAFAEFTEKRIELLNNRLKKLNLKSDLPGG
jgi:uncharacterized protein YecT (DUF1311 family)